MSSILAPIVLFVYNRPKHTQQTLEALAANKLANDSILYIYCDGPPDNSNEELLNKIIDVKSVIRQKKWCKDVIIRESSINEGLARSIVQGVTEVVNKHGKVIVLEDDIVTSPGFLKYMNEALSIYENEERVMHISGFMPYTTGAQKLCETFFLRFMSCWGWATWKNPWDRLIIDNEFLYNEIINRKDFKDFDLDGYLNQFAQIEQNISGKIKTWAIKWYATIFLNQGLCLYPNKSLVKQIGFDGSGVHCGIDTSNMYDVDLTDEIKLRRIKIVESKKGKRYIKRFYKYGRNSSFPIRIKYYRNVLKIKVKTVLNRRGNPLTILKRLANKAFLKSLI